MNKRIKMVCLMAIGFATAFAATHAAAASGTCTISPSTPTAGETATITYNPTGGPLVGSSKIYIHFGINGWNPTNGTDYALVQRGAVYICTFTVPDEAGAINCAFNNGTTWDNHSNANWNFTVKAETAPVVGPPPALPANDSTAGVMMEGFYWNCPANWYATYMTPNAAALRNMQGGYGIDRIWFPPPQKSASGSSSMGYDPYDYYDIGQLNQKGTIATHFGTQAQLRSAIAAFHAQGIVCMADLVLNHRTGGANETNPNTGTTTPTNFTAVASGKCKWTYNQFHPSTFSMFDQSTFNGWPDVCHVTGTTTGSADYDQIAWAQWLTNTVNAGFDGGWRFDLANYYQLSTVADVRTNTGNAFGVGEFSWSSTISQLDADVKYSGNTHAFDFPAVNTMASVFNSGANIAELVNPAYTYAAHNRDYAVTFVANHDQDQITKNKMLAYCYILTYQGYPCIFWKDYFNNGLSTLGGLTGNGINALVGARGALAGGNPSIQNLYTSSTSLLVYGTASGTTAAPGYIVAINNGTSPQSATVTTSDSQLQGRTLQCVAWYSYTAGQNVQPANVTCSSTGTVTVQPPAEGYAVYGPLPSTWPGPWVAQDVGAVGVTGTSTYSTGTFTVAGSGADIGETADAFQYAYENKSGDCSIVARVVSQQNTNTSSKAGVMIRETTATGARNAGIFVTPAEIVFQWRTTTGGTTVTSRVLGLSAPYWLKVTRSSNVFSAYYSPDGSTWTQMGTGQTISMATSVLDGMAVTSHANTMLSTATFDNVTTTP